ICGRWDFESRRRSEPTILGSANGEFYVSARSAPAIGPGSFRHSIPKNERWDFESRRRAEPTILGSANGAFYVSALSAPAIGAGSFRHSIPKNQRWLTASSVTGPASRVGYLGYDTARPQRAPPANSSNPGRTLSAAKPWPASAAMRTPAKI